MSPGDKQAFSEVLAQVHAYYRQELSPWALAVWWDALKGYDLVAIRDALGRHAVNPDTGQFCPKVADVVKMMQGTSLDGALQAWSKVVQAIRRAGPWKSVVFDDPLIHRVIEEMGGWAKLNAVTEDELPFRAKEFENRYRGYSARSLRPEYPAVMIGLAEASNASKGLKVEPPLLIGDTKKAQLVMERGGEGGQLPMVPLKDLLPRLEVTA